MSGLIRRYALIAPRAPFMKCSVRVPVSELNQVGEARRAVTRACEGMGLDETIVGRAALVVSELARNLVVHAGGGDVVIHEFLRGKQRGIEILAIDRGQGMKNVGECFRDGYSTAGTAGTGLGAARRMADFLDLTTQDGKGTVICARLYVSREVAANNSFDVGAVNIPITGEIVCGDNWSTLERNGGLRGLVADGLGHGERAAEASAGAVLAFEKNAERPLEEIVQRMHESLLKTRGAAAAVIDINPSASEIAVAGVGNIVARVLNRNGGSRQLASSNGTLGATITRVHTFRAAWNPESIVVVHSDGLTANWDLSAYPGLLQRHPSTIAGVLYRDFSRGRDDATVVVISKTR